MAEPLKDQFLTPNSLAAMADAIQAVYPAFDRQRFLTLVLEDEQWEPMALMARMHHVTRGLSATLPQDYSQAVAILKAAAPSIGGFEALALPDFVEMFGQEDWEVSLPALGFLTRYGSGEFAIRPFLDRDPDRALSFLHQWAQAENEAVRRLASEGSRPRLPWGKALPKFQADPEPVLALLERLKDDESETVRRSVANNLNDISKDNPERMLDVCERWYGDSPNTDWIVKHACRSLLKAGHPRALKLFGYGEAGGLRVEDLETQPDHPAIGGELMFSFRFIVEGAAARPVRLEYAIEFVKARGNTTRKVFMLSEKEYVPRTHNLTRKHSLAQRTTRVHYPGLHRLTILANGDPKAQVAFQLHAPEE